MRSDSLTNDHQSGDWATVEGFSRTPLDEFTVYCVSIDRGRNKDHLLFDGDPVCHHLVRAETRRNGRSEDVTLDDSRILTMHEYRSQVDLDTISEDGSCPESLCTSCWDRARYL